MKVDPYALTGNCLEVWNEMLRGSRRDISGAGVSYSFDRLHATCTKGDVSEVAPTEYIYSGYDQSISHGRSFRKCRVSSLEPSGNFTLKTLRNSR